MATIGTPARNLSKAERNSRLALGLSIGIDEARLEPQSLWEGFGTIAGPIAQSSTPILRLAQQLGFRGLPDDTIPAIPRQFGGLKSLIDVVHDQAPVAYGLGQIEIAVPFSQVAVLTDDSIVGLDNLERTLTDAMEREFGAFIDPRQPPRVRFFMSPGLGSDPRGNRHLRFYVGNGIFVPPRYLAKHTQVGQLWLRRPGDATTFVPILPSGDVAAFHEGQTGLAFSGDVGLAPAVCRDVLNRDAAEFGTVFYVGRLRDTEGVTFRAWRGKPGDGVDVRVRYQVTLPEQAHQEMGEEADLEPYRWYGVRRYVEGSGGPSRELAFEFYFAPDSERPGRLLAHLPDGPALEVTGIVLPYPSMNESVARVWVDFDAEGRPVSNFLSARLQSLVIGPTGLAGLFDRVRGAFLERGVPVSERPAFTIAGRQVKIEDMSDGGVPRLLLQSSGGPGFGYISLPSRTEAPRGFNVGSVATAEPANRSSDWLDAAALVEMAADDEVQASAAEGVVRRQPFLGLSGWHKDYGSGAGALQWDASGNLRVVRESGGAQPVAPGVDFMLGPLRVRYDPG